MIPSSASFKFKPKINLEVPPLFTAPLQSQKIRKSTATNYLQNRLQIPIKKDKPIYRRFVTESNQPQYMLGANKSFKQFRISEIGGSPTEKKSVVTDIDINNKLSFNNTASKIKRVVKKPLNTERITTETGPNIPRILNLQSLKLPFSRQKQIQKVIFPLPRDRSFLQLKKQNPFPKRTMESNPNLTMKGRKNTEGTMDSTPTIITSYDVELIQIIGQGTFGKVYKAILKRTREVIAVKKVFQDPKYKNREVQIVNMLKGDFVMKVLGCYTTTEEKSQFLNIVMTYYQGDLYNMIKQNGRKGLSTMDIKIFSYQIFRGLLFVHQLKIAHRDIKPHNVLFKGKKIAICDFGSAKVLTKESNLPYICSRCYRAPELIFGATHYTTMIDIWSVGCVILEMIQGSPLFMGESSIDHLIEIMKVLGTPTKSQVIDMNPNYDLKEYKFPKVKKREWNKIFPKVDPLLIDLISEIMIYSPLQRLNAAQALAHQFFDELREEEVHKMLIKQYGLNLFSFLPQELKGYDHLMPKLLPEWYEGKSHYRLF